MKLIKLVFATIAVFTLSLTCAIGQDNLNTVPAIVTDETTMPTTFTGWLAFITAVIALILPAVQFVLKRIPTVDSIKITGILGKILDALTFFQRDKVASKN